MKLCIVTALMFTGSPEERLEPVGESINLSKGEMFVLLDEIKEQKNGWYLQKILSPKCGILWLSSTWNNCWKSI